MSQHAKEWEAWRAMCTTLEELGININKEDTLAEAIKQWGAALVTLRQSQRKGGWQ